MYPIPELSLHVDKAISPFSIFGDESMLDLEQSISIDYCMRRNEFIINKLNSLAFEGKLYPIRPLEQLCGNNHCSIILNGSALLMGDIGKINSQY